MADNGGGGGGFTGFIAALLLVALLAVGFVVWQGGFGHQQADISVDLPEDVEIPTPNSGGGGG